MTTPGRTRSIARFGSAPRGRRTLSASTPIAHRSAGGVKMSKISLLARNCTMFSKTKDLDEEAFRKSLQSFVDYKISPFLASGGSGEANSLSWDDLCRVY